MVVDTGDKQPKNPHLDIFELLHEMATGRQIHHFLEKKKIEKSDTIKTSGALTKQVEELKRLKNSGTLTNDDLFELLQESEENGNQHIYFYRPTDNDVIRRCRDSEGIAKRLFGDNWRATKDFPKLTYLPDGYAISDFRSGLSHRKPNDWTLKIYGYRKRRVQVGEGEVSQAIIPKEETNKPTEQINKGRVLRHIGVFYTEYETRAVCLARWNDHPTTPLLEIRVPCDRDADKLGMEQGILWKELKEAISRYEFKEWDLTECMSTLVRRCESNVNLYGLSDTGILDHSSGSIIIKPRTKKEFLSDASVRVEVANKILDKDGRCKKLVVHWLDATGDILPERILRTTLCPDHPHEITVLAQTSSVAVDHVTDQLRHFGKSEPGTIVSMEGTASLV